MNKQRLMPFAMGFLALAVGVIVNYYGDRFMNAVSPMPGIRLELFWGVATFSPLWIVTLFIVPFIAGFAVSMVYGLGGKMLCYFVPIIVRTASYIEMHNYQGLPEGVVLLPVAYWLLVMIVAIEAAAFGGVFGEIMIKKTYGRRPSELLYKKSNNKSSADS